MPLVVLDRLRIVPFGWVSCVDTVNSKRSESSIVECSTKVQVMTTLFTGLDGVLVREKRLEGELRKRRADY